jgi:hypothetical protein
MIESRWYRLLVRKVKGVENRLIETFASVMGGVCKALRLIYPLVFFIFNVNFLFYSSDQFFQFDSSKKGKEKNKIIALAEKTVEFYRC